MMGSIKEGAKIIASKCANCKHPRLSHMKVTYRDPQRQNPKTVKRIDIECADCKKQGKKCAGFKSK